ncbi:UMP-CMP kinase, putative [Plasmodium ovale wallikeri]|uniref:UMP-CMP kinase, putative n=1 Tax=Plasmodium ovale wallikeri TaxID=864142 RepID=A0A1A8YIR0_PLAOA|nr:UMP-CMP kinase, putative [Plasmodium ovale wallikeri]
MIIPRFPFFFAENLSYLKNKKKKYFYLPSTNVYYNSGTSFFKNHLEKHNIRRLRKFKRNAVFETNKFYINRKLEEQFFANNTFTMSRDQPFVVRKNKTNEENSRGSKRKYNKGWAEEKMKTWVFFSFLFLVSFQVSFLVSFPPIHSLPSPLLSLSPFSFPLLIFPFKIFMLGGPGSGKGTQCKLIQDKFDFVHISKIAPVHITLELMKKKMQAEIEKIKQKEKNEMFNDKEHRKEEGKKSFSFNALDDNIKLKNTDIDEYNKKLKYENNIFENKEVLKVLEKNKFEQKAKYKFIIDGFPRNYDNFNGWMNIIGSYAYVHLCLFLYCDEDIMVKRCMNRGRADDNMKTLRKRFETHKNDCMPIINIFLNENKCIFINANKNIEDVWNDIQYVFTNM